MQRIVSSIVATLLVAAITTPPPAMAHGGQDLIYPGSGCRLEDDAVIDQAQPHTQAARQLRNIRRQSLFSTRFGGLQNVNETLPIPIVCPIVRGAIGKSSGIFVAVKFRTVIDSLHQNVVSEEFRCTVRNVGSNGQTATEVRSSKSQLQNVRADDTGTFSLILNSSNTLNAVGSKSGGGYTLTCWLPPVRGGVRSELIHYAVSEFD
ncbi:MAG: hypothetical protein AAGH83_05035 [Pseudomonadota bacterium]